MTLHEEIVEIMQRYAPTVGVQHLAEGADEIIAKVEANTIPYLVDYRAGWNDALAAMAKAGASRLNDELWLLARSMSKENEHYYSKEWKDEMIQDQGVDDE